jgi:hypothetical protein
MNVRRSFEGGSGGGMPPSLSAEYFYADDFTGNLDSTAAVAAGGANSFLAADPATPGLYRQAVTAAADASRITLAGSAITSICFSGGVWTFELRGRIEVLSDGVNNIVVRWGPGDQATAGDVTDGVYLEYDFATHGHHRWMLCAANNAVRTKVDTGIAAVAATLQTAIITVNATGTEASVTIDGVAGALTVTSNIPVTSARACALCVMQAVKQLGAGGLSTTLDYQSARFQATVPR